MPALDQCEPQVIRALQKAGWIVTHQPVALRIDETKRTYVFADLRLRQSDGQIIIIIEMKCFARPRRLLDDLYQAIGQYIVYRNALVLKAMDTPLYLSVPSHIYSTFFQEPLIQSSIKDADIKLVIVDLNNEEVVSWIT